MHSSCSAWLAFIIIFATFSLICPNVMNIMQKVNVNLTQQEAMISSFLAVSTVRGSMFTEILETEHGVIAAEIWFRQQKAPKLLT